MPSPISSPQNERIKAVVRLEKRAERDRLGMTAVEGTREVSRALAAGHIPREAYLCPTLVRDAEGEASLRTLARLEVEQRTRLFEVTPEVYARMAVREESGGILLLMPYFARTLAAIPLGTPPFLVVIEGVEKPGNLGAILRTADAAGVDGVIVSAGATDVHNPNVVRASLGTIFTVPLCEASPTDTVAFLRRHAITIVATTPEATTNFTQADLRGPVAVVMGSEAHGISPLWHASADLRVSIPMRGAADSLNLATATALLLYEVLRQRGTTT